MEEEGWRPRESFGAGGNSLTARGRRNGFWPDNAQVTHHPSCLLKTVISNSLPFLRPLIFSAPVLLLICPFLHGPYLSFLSLSFSSHLSHITSLSTCGPSLSFAACFLLGASQTSAFRFPTITDWISGHGRPNIKAQTFSPSLSASSLLSH